MLTPKEQSEIFQKAMAFARLRLSVHRRLQKSEIAPRQARERVERAEAELREMLRSTH